jgi:hypothetical protein
MFLIDSASDYAIQVGYQEIASQCTHQIPKKKPPDTKPFVSGGLIVTRAGFYCAVDLFYCQNHAMSDKTHNSSAFLIHEVVTKSI